MHQQGKAERAGTWLRVFRRENAVRVLGPGCRAVLWVQGCPLACPGCIVPESWPEQGGNGIDVSSLADWLVSLENIDGLTLSGGEPMAQAEALCALIEEVRTRRELPVMCYTGYTLEYLRQRGTAAQQKLLSHIDLLVDGPYRADLHADLAWRGSSNQRLIPLTDRYVPVVAALVEVGTDHSAGLEFRVDGEGVTFTGIPPVPGFREAWETGLLAQGISLRVDPHGQVDPRCQPAISD